MLTRRKAIQQVLLFSAGAALIPSCMDDKSKASVVLKKISVSGKQEALLADLAETIIPKTNTPGAKDISAHLFALKMLDDCTTKEDQAKFQKGLADFEKYVDQKTSKSFSELTPEEKLNIVNILYADKQEQPDDLHFFFNKMRGLTIQAYTNSKFYLTTVNVYHMIPGRFEGCVPVGTL